MGSRRSTCSSPEGSRSTLSSWTCRCPTCRGWRSWSGSGRSTPGRRSCCPAGTGMTRPVKRIAGPKHPRSSPNHTAPICWRASSGTSWTTGRCDRRPPAAPRYPPAERTRGEDIGEVPPDPGQGIPGKGAGKPDDQLLSDIPHAVEDPVEAQDLLHGFLHVVGDPEEGKVLGGNQLPAEQVPRHELLPESPVVPPGLVQENDREERALPGLQEGQNLERLVQRPEPPGEEGHAAGLLDEEEFAGEEIFHMDELRIARDDPVGALLEGKEDVDPHGQVLARPDVGGFHDPPAPPGNDHPSLPGPLPAERHGLAVGGGFR